MKLMCKHQNFTNLFKSFVHKNNQIMSSSSASYRTDKCLELLCATGRFPEAAFFARTYIPSRISE